MWRVTLTSLRAKKLRLITTALAVMLGVAFMAGTLVLTDTLGRTFDGLLANANQGTDAYVRSSNEVTDGLISVRPRITASLAQTISHVPGVAGAAGYVEGYAQIVGKDGKVLGNPAQGAPTIGASWTTVPELNPYHVVEGTPPSAPTDVVIDKHTADDGDLHVGDQITILSKSNPEVFTITGIAKFGTADSMGGVQASLFASDTAQRLLSEPGQVDAIRVLAADGTTQAELTDRIAPTLPKGTEVLTGDAITKEQQADTRKQMGFITTFLMVFADIAILVGAFIIANTFSIIVAQRSREMALLRAIGASRKQVLRSVLAEAAVVGLFASVARPLRRSRRCRRHQGPLRCDWLRDPRRSGRRHHQDGRHGAHDGHRCHGRLGLAPRSSWIEGRAGRGHAGTGRRGGPQLEAADRFRPRHHGCRRCRSGGRPRWRRRHARAPRRPRCVRRHRGARSAAGPSGRTRDRRSAPPAGHHGLTGP